MNGQEVNLLNPGTDGLTDFLTIAKDAATGKETDNFMSKLSMEGRVAMTNLINLTLQASFKDRWSKEQDELKRWGFKNGMAIIDFVMKECMPEGDNRISKAKEDLLKRIDAKE